MQQHPSSTRPIKMDNGRQAKVKMSGCLFKKIKKRMMSTWKMYWFVLEDRLLLYYRSKDEYQAISPCKGSINLGPPCIVKSCPSMANAFQIETRTTTFTLRAENIEDQMKWMQAIMSALNQNQNFTAETPKKLNHFRYSLDDLVPEREPGDCHILKKGSLERQNTMPATVETTRDSNEIIQRLQKIGAHSYGGSLGAISKMSVKKCTSPVLSNRERNSQAEDSKIEPVLRPVRELGDNIYERISGDSNSSQLSNRTSFIVDNENYSVPLRKTVVKPVTNTKSLLVENDQYGATHKLPTMNKTNSLVVENDQYATPQNLRKTLKKTNSLVVENDNYATTQNLKATLKKTNSLVVENDQYSQSRPFQSDEVIYAEPKINEVDHNKNSVFNGENVYEDLDMYSHYSRPVLKNEETSSQSSHESKNKTRAKSKNGKDKKVKKSKSFIKRVWKKRSKKIEKQESQEEDLYAEVDQTAVEKIEYNNENAMQMLSELQNILEHKKTMLKTTSASNSREQPEDAKPDEASTSISDVCPSLPPKTQKQQHDILKINRPIELDKVKSLDEILEDLDKEKLETKNKVKMLIEKFSEPDDVILRKHDKPDFKTDRHSDDLNQLLDELAKVTSAPIMTPGVTSSLVNPNLKDEEWLKLLPLRQRRLSEPDYDVPRPHKSIQLPVKHENADAIPVTRFFGPVLPPTMTDNSPTKEDSLCTSMALDSLEVEVQPKTPNQCSYTSHNYYQQNESKDLKCFPHSYKDDKIIYAMPKSYLSVATHIVNTCQNICSAQLAEDCTIIYKNVKNVDIPEEIFSDSLELCNEPAPQF